MSIRVHPVASAAQKKAFINFPYEAYANDPLWRAPLKFERYGHFNPKENPTLSELSPTFFLAWDGEEIVGRIAAFINPSVVKLQQKQIGHFGFLDISREGDSETVRALMEAAESHVQAKGASAIGGPYNFSVNDECGLLIDGFNTPPSVLMPHNRRDLPDLLEQCGYKKAMDLYAYVYRMNDQFSSPSFVTKVKKRFDKDPSYSVRSLDRSRFDEDIALVVDIFNDAWSDNWGFIPFGSEEAAHMAKSLKMLLTPESLWISSVDGQTASFTMMLPNLNEATLGLKGNLLPFGWAKFLYRLKMQGVKSGRIPIAGTRKAFHKTRQGMTATVGAWEACLRAQHGKGIREVEFSWVLETNKDLIGLTEVYNCDRYKTYRLYEKQL